MKLRIATSVAIAAVLALGVAALQRRPAPGPTGDLFPKPKMAPR